MNIDPPRTYTKFSQMCDMPVDEILHIYHNTLFFREYESGRISDRDFRENIRQKLNCKGSDAEIDEAWNSLLIGIPDERLEMLREAAGIYRTFLLSNTNNIHRIRFEKFFEDAAGSVNVHSYFDKVYYSYRMNLRKPDPEIYKFVLSDNNLAPSETLLVDDNEENCESAKSLGMQVQHVEMNRPDIKIPVRQ